ncbi:MAG: GNAT family N-acetyltransferase, partial [Pseudomonadota bacterium]
MSAAPSLAQIGPSDVFDALEATWPPAAWHEADGWRIGAGGGGGKRVSAARALAETPDIAAMERAQEALGQPPLVMVR